ncbi:MAG TPA: phytanoyl-CoA dioxygenase family protein [Allosphingosinicella sp.]|nr:phytanoyl-CoA dioxygenase family protein [Allosphingosinicella sp.]
MLTPQPDQKRRAVRAADARPTFPSLPTAAQTAGRKSAVTGSEASRGQSPASKAPHSELLKLAQSHASHSLLQILEMFGEGRWHIEDLSAEQRRAYARINGLKALRIIRDQFEDRESRFPLNSPPTTAQWVRTGTYVHVRGLLDRRQAEKLSARCDALLGKAGTPPLRIFEHPDILGRPELERIVRAALEAVPDLPGGIVPTIVKKRALVRRTFPASRLQSHEGNANNQHWHQDSNAQFNDRPMLTLWIPLQDVAGGMRPGLQLIDAPVAYFSNVHGDSSPTALQALGAMFPGVRAVTIEASAGDGIIFNGLTFHRTSTSASMVDHRDALLIRIIDRKSAASFPGAERDEDVLALA